MHLRVLAAIALVAVTPTSLAHADDEPLPAAAQQAPEPPQRKPRWVRIALGTLGLTAIGQAWYWRGGAATNADDRAFDSAGSALWAKATGNGFRWDGDGFDTNALKHPLFGFASYALARENGLGVAGSLVYASVTSFAWETLGEIREYASYNDLLVTSPAGIPTGETLHMMLHERRGREITVRLGAGEHSEPGSSTSFAVVGASGSTGVLGHTRAHWSAEMPYDDAGQRGLMIAAQTDFPITTRDNTHLYLGTVFDYRRRIERMNQAWELHSMVKAGPGVALELAPGDARIVIAAEAMVETGPQSSRAFARWREDHPTEYVRSSLQLNPHGYYHAVGAGGRLHVDASFGPLRARALASIAAYRAIGGTDQFEEMVTARPALVDVEQHLASEITATYSRLSVGLELSAWRFVGWAGNARTTTQYQDVTVRTGVSF
jgi:hypothetical protein